ncbi:acetoacetate decarboxylase (plasmid) [Pantoea sp. C3]|uniref:acetoacetate decarboxylase n=1 Tax=Pantoea phytostimulans TaxID=2769024 RepID=UPI0038F6DADC
MTEDEIRKNAFSGPFTSPGFPRPPFRFKNREILIISYRTDPEALRKVVPEPLTFDEPVVKYEFIKMPDSSGLGSYTESGQIIPVSYQGNEGSYTHAMYLNSFPGVTSGREMYGYPKKLAEPLLEVRSDTLVGTLDYQGIRVATATMGYKYQPLDVAEIKASLLKPGYLLKTIPDPDGTARICELVVFTASEINVKEAWSGPASLELHPHCFAPVSSLPVLEILSAVYIITDLTLDNARIIHNYL